MQSKRGRGKFLGSRCAATADNKVFRHGRNLKMTNFIWSTIIMNCKHVFKFIMAHRPGVTMRRRKCDAILNGLVLNIMPGASSVVQENILSLVGRSYQAPKIVPAHFTRQQPLSTQRSALGRVTPNFFSQPCRCSCLEVWTDFDRTWKIGEPYYQLSI